MCVCGPPINADDEDEECCCPYSGGRWSLSNRLACNWGREWGVEVPGTLGSSPGVVGGQADVEDRSKSFGRAPSSRELPSRNLGLGGGGASTQAPPGLNTTGLGEGDRLFGVGALVSI